MHQIHLNITAIDDGFGPSSASNRVSSLLDQLVPKLRLYVPEPKTSEEFDPLSVNINITI